MDTFQNDPTAHPESGEDPNTEPPLVFNYREQPVSYFRLLNYLAIAAVAYAGFFYLFKVVPPSTTRRVPKPQTVTLLRSSDADAQRLFRANEAKIPLGLMPGFIVRRESDEPEIPKRGRELSFLMHRAKPVVGELNRMELPSLLPQKPLLPAVVSAAAEADPKRTSLSATNIPDSDLVLPTALNDRRPMGKWSYSPTTPQEEPSLRHELSLLLGAEGRVQHVVANSPKCDPALVSALRALKFPPVATPQPQWYEFSVITFAAKTEVD